MIDLYPHQQLAVEQLRSGSILCGGVGSGKSRTALAYYFSKVCKDRMVDLYVITTARKRDTGEWHGELSVFPCCDRCIFHIDSYNNIEKYESVHDSFFIFDEQRLVGNGAWVRSFLKITKHNAWILLTATPGDTWSDYIPVFIANGFYKNRSEFARNHIIFDRFAKYPKIDRYVNCGELVEHRREILVMMNYSTKAEHNVEFANYQYDAAEYKRILKERMIAGQPIENPASLVYHLRETSATFGKMRALATLLSEHPKAIVFYNYDYELDQLRLFFELNNPYGYGEYNGHRHDPLPRGDRWIYLVQYTAGAEGWNCIDTDTIIFYSPSYSYKQMLQAAGRIDRLNTPFNKLNYVIMRCDAPVENRIFECLKNKEDFNEHKYKEEYKGK